MRLSLVAFLCLATATFAEKTPPPDFLTYSQVSRNVRNSFKEDFANATKPAQQSQLAQKLLHAAADEKEDPARCYAMLMLASNLATDAGDVDTATSAAKAIIDSYSVDPLKLKLDIAQELEKSALMP